MCVSGSKPTPATVVQQTQAAKQPEQSATGASTARKSMQDAAGMAGSTLLTGPSGIENSALNLQKKTLLGQ